jgi:hypothetical protein
VTVSDTLGNTFESAPSQSEGPCASQVQIWYASGVTGGSDTITVSRASGSIPFQGIFALEYSGVAATGAFDSQAGKAASVNGSTMDTGSLDTSGTHDLIVALFSDGAESGQMTPGAGFRSLGVDNGYNAIIEDNLPGGAAPGSHVATATLPAKDTYQCWVGTAVAFKAQ